MSEEAPRNPFRQVIYILHKVGPLGGEYWDLLLECGHSAFRRLPRFDITAFMGRPFKPESHSAPQKVRCLLCGLGIDPLSPELTTLLFERYVYEGRRTGDTV